MIASVPGGGTVRALLLAAGLASLPALSPIDPALQTSAGPGSARPEAEDEGLLTVEASAARASLESDPVLATDDGVLPFVVDRGEDALPLLVPRDEELVFEVNVSWGVIGTALGTVTLSAGVDEYRGSLLMPSGTNGDEPQFTAWMKAHARGETAVYTMDATLEARHQPQEWPRIVYRSEQTGSERRRREILVGVRDGKHQSSYRRDTDNGAPRGRRIWKEPGYRDVPPTTLDMTSAVYLLRSFLRDVARGGERTTTFPVVQKEELWLIELRLGETAVQPTKAGSFEAVQVILIAKAYPGEDAELEDEKFSGLFGLRGSIDLWVDRETGVPVRVQGEIPAGPTSVDVDLRLASYRGTPLGFQPQSP